MVVRYELPDSWIKYDILAVSHHLIEAKAAVLSLRSIPYQRSWADKLQEVQLKHEVAGTSRIEGAVFSEPELDAALRDETPEESLNRSQRQARAAVRTYRWIAKLPDDRPIDEELVREVHRRIVAGCDDDHCPPGELRGSDQNVIFGAPRHRGAEGGAECETAFQQLIQAVQTNFLAHDELVQSLAFHYHIGAMHPFLDGNGRTARAVEALILQRAGLRDDMFIAMSNYYYDAKPKYLESLGNTAASGHDLTEFVIFGLKGICQQCERLRTAIQTEVSKSLYRDVMYNLFNRLRTQRKRVIADRQIQILHILLGTDSIEIEALYDIVEKHYQRLKKPYSAYIRDLNNLLRLGAIAYDQPGENQYILSVRLEWPTQITETKWFEVMNTLPKAKTYKLFQEDDTDYEA